MHTRTCTTNPEEPRRRRELRSTPVPIPVLLPEVPGQGPEHRKTYCSRLESRPDLRDRWVKGYNFGWSFVLRGPDRGRDLLLDPRRKGPEVGTRTGSLLHNRLPNCLRTDLLLLQEVSCLHLSSSVFLSSFPMYRKPFDDTECTGTKLPGPSLLSV